MCGLYFLIHTVQVVWHSDKQPHLENNAHAGQYTEFPLLAAIDLSKQPACRAKYFSPLRNHEPSACSAETIQDVRDAYHVMLN